MNKQTAHEERELWNERKKNKKLNIGTKKQVKERHGKKEKIDRQIKHEY